MRVSLQSWGSVSTYVHMKTKSALGVFSSEAVHHVFGNRAPYLSVSHQLG